MYCISTEADILLYFMYSLTFILAVISNGFTKPYFSEDIWWIYETLTWTAHMKIWDIGVYTGEQANLYKRWLWSWPGWFYIHHHIWSYFCWLVPFCVWLNKHPFCLCIQKLCFFFSFDYSCYSAQMTLKQDGPIVFVNYKLLLHLTFFLHFSYIQYIHNQIPLTNVTIWIEPNNVFSHIQNYVIK